MKTKTAIVTLFAMLLLIVSPSMNSFAAEQMGFSLDSVEEAKQGDTVNVSIKVDAAGLTDGKAIVTYDSDKMAYEGGKLAYCDNNEKSEFAVNSQENGKLIIAWATVEPLEKAGNIISLDFKVNDSVPNNEATEVNLEVKYANDKSGKSIPIKADSKNSILIKIGTIGTEEPGDNPDNKPGDNPGNKPGDNPDNKPGDNPGAGTGDKPGNNNTGSSDKNSNGDVKTGDSSLIGFGLIIVVSLVALAALKKHNAGRDRA